MKVLFIYPPTSLINREDRCQVPTGKVPIAPAIPPTDLMYMASSAEAGGADCKIIDYPATGRDINAFLNDLKEYRPDLLVISTTTPTLLPDLEVCKAAKQTLEGLTIIAKGAHFLVFDQEVLLDHPEVDILLRGEPEPIVRRICSGESLANIPGITWRKDREVIHNPDAEFELNLDAFPVPARHLIDNRLYVRPDNGRVQGIIKCSRGCPYNCFFCLATPVSGRKVRMRSPENILDEIRYCIKTYGMNDFILWSDVFNFDDRWVRQLCEAILSSGLRFTWAANMRADNVNEETLKLMLRSGCTLISIGIESGSQSILDKAGKKVTVQEIRSSVSLIRKAGIASFGYFMIGLPWETKDTANETIKLSLELNCDFANFFVAAPFPGTSFFTYAVENRLFDEDNPEDSRLFQGAYGSAIVRGHNLNKNEINMLYKKAIEKFYMRPAYIAKRLMKIRSLSELKAYSKAALSIGTNR